MSDGAVLTIQENTKSAISGLFSNLDVEPDTEYGDYEDVSDLIDGKNQRPLERAKREAR